MRIPFVNWATPWAIAWAIDWAIAWTNAWDIPWAIAWTNALAIARAALLSGVLFGMAGPAAAAEGEPIARAKTMAVQRCPRLTLDEMARSFFEAPRWEERTDADGQPRVTVWGRMRYPNPEGVYARIWYDLHPERGLLYRHIDFSGIVQLDFIYRGRLKRICQG